MKKSILFYLPVLFFFFASCGGNKDNKGNNDSVADTTKNETTETKAKFPFDFPETTIEAEEGDYVLCPSYKMWTKSLEAEDPTKETYIFYTSTMSKPGEKESEIEFTFDGKQMMPNSILITIPKGQTVSVGDVVLTWWQTGSGMMRAIVTDASNPSEPMVRYLDLIGNPAKDRETGKSIGETDYKLKPNSFVKLSDEWQVGNLIAAKEESRYVSVQIVKIAGDKVLTIGFAGKMKVFAKSDCIPAPLIPDVKKGDKVQAVFVGSFSEATVKKVDEKYGLVYVDQYDKEVALPFGEVIKSLP